MFISKPAAVNAVSNSGQLFDDIPSLAFGLRMQAILGIVASEMELNLNPLECRSQV
jgi:hypothetical protein